MAGRECAEMIQAVEAVSRHEISIKGASIKWGVSRSGIHAAMARRRAVSDLAVAAAHAVRAGADEARACLQFQVSPEELKQALKVVRPLG